MHVEEGVIASKHKWVVKYCEEDGKARIVMMEKGNIRADGEIEQRKILRERFYR